MGWAAKVARFLGVAYTNDDTPWCGLFAAWVMNEHGLKPPKIAVRASAWSDWGQALVHPTPGCIITFTRQGGGHVGFYLSEDAESYHVLGGNQSNAVTITKIAKNRVSAYRWPAEAARPTSGRVRKVFTGKLSINEA